MLKNLIKYSGILLGLTSIALLAITFVNPPTDYDGGPMLAYNFFFFFPMIIVAFILSIIAITITFRNRILKTGSKAINISSIVLSSPGILFFSFILLKIFIFSDPIPEDKPDRIFNNSIEIELPENVVHFTGFNFGNDYERRRIYISNLSYNDGNFNIEDAYFCQGYSDFELFYSVISDSIVIYIPNKEPMYRHIKRQAENLAPVRAIQLTNEQLDSLNNLQTSGIKQFEWTETKEPNKR